MLMTIFLNIFFQILVVASVDPILYIFSQLRRNSSPNSQNETKVALVPKRILLLSSF